jgi:hypothetical protein
MVVNFLDGILVNILEIVTLCRRQPRLQAQIK